MLFLVAIYSAIIVLSVSNRRRSALRNDAQYSIRKSEVRLTVLAAILSLIITVFVGHDFCVVLVNSRIGPDWLITLLSSPFSFLRAYLVPVSQFVFNVGNPYILLIMSSQVRRSFLEALHMDKYFYKE